MHVNENAVQKLEELAVNLESISEVVEANKVFQIAIWLAGFSGNKPYHETMCQQK
jgi:hypothetical protein